VEADGLETGKGRIEDFGDYVPWKAYKVLRSGCTLPPPNTKNAHVSIYFRAGRIPVIARANEVKVNVSDGQAVSDFFYGLLGATHRGVISKGEDEYSFHKRTVKCADERGASMTSHYTFLIEKSSACRGRSSSSC
jgi:hypothetical protein